LKEIIRVQNIQLIEMSAKYKNGYTLCKIEMDEKIDLIKQIVKAGLKKATSIDNRKATITNQSIIDLLKRISDVLTAFGDDKNEN